MSQRSRRRYDKVFAALWCLLVLPNCRNENAPKPPSSPDSTAESPPAAPRSAGDRAERPGGEAIDARDDPSAPAALPKSGVAGHWQKHEPVRVLKAAELAEVISSEDAARWTRFRIVSAAACAYALPRAGSPLVARVLLVEAESAADAYGLMTCQSNSAQTPKIAGETRFDRRDGLCFHSWQGRHYVRVWTATVDETALAETRRLLMVITAQVPREAAPDILAALPAEGALPGKRWLVRDLRSLSPTMLDVPGLDLERVNALLGLGDDAWMCIASYAVPQAQRPNTAWLVRYPTAERAKQAYTRYTRHLKQATDASTASTNLMRPHGSFLIGTWTAEEESLLHMMPRIRQLLPS